jgi:glycerol-3-phosphate dehydrogenase
VRTSRGSHLILPPRDGELALAAFLPDQRIQFVVPHDDGTLCGTTDVDDPLPGDETGPPQQDLDYLLQALAFLLDPAPKPKPTCGSVMPAGARCRAARGRPAR